MRKFLASTHHDLLSDAVRADLRNQQLPRAPPSSSPGPEETEESHIGTNAGNKHAENPVKDFSVN